MDLAIINMISDLKFYYNLMYYLINTIMRIWKNVKGEIEDSESFKNYLMVISIRLDRARRWGSSCT